MNRVYRSATLCALIAAGCHGTDLRVGTGHSRGGGGSSGLVEASGKHGGAASYDVDQGDTTSLWLELGFQLTPQTVVVRYAGDHPGETPIFPPRPVVEELVAAPSLPLLHARRGGKEEPDDPAPLPRAAGGGFGEVSWSEVVVAIAGLLALLLGGNHVRRRRRRRAVAP